MSGQNRKYRYLETRILLTVSFGVLFVRPYFLRRTKEQVLSLPPLGEVIVPVSMRPLQKQIYK